MQQKKLLFLYSNVTMPDVFCYLALLCVTREGKKRGAGGVAGADRQRAPWEEEGQRCFGQGVRISKPFFVTATMWHVCGEILHEATPMALRSGMLSIRLT